MFCKWCASLRYLAIQIYRSIIYNRATYFLYSDPAYLYLDPVAAIPAHMLKDLEPGSAVDAFVTSVQWCKRHQAPEYEFLVFNVRERNTPRRTVLSLERHFYVGRERSEEGQRDLIVSPIVVDIGTAQRVAAGGRRQEEEDTDSLKYSPPMVSGSKVVQIGDFLTFSGNGLASFLYEFDMVTNKQHDGYDVLATLTIPQGRFCVAQLSVLAYATDHCDLTQFVWPYQNYWYANVIYNVIKMQCEGKCREWKRRKFTRAGTSKNVPELQKVEATTIEDIKKKFELGWEAHKVEVANWKEEIQRRITARIESANRASEIVDPATEEAHKATERIGQLEEPNDVQRPPLSFEASASEVHSTS